MIQIGCGLVQNILRWSHRRSRFESHHLIRKSSEVNISGVSALDIPPNCWPQFDEMLVRHALVVCHELIRFGSVEQIFKVILVQKVIWF